MGFIMHCTQSEKNRRLKQGKPDTFLFKPIRQAIKTNTEVLPDYLNTPKKPLE